MRPAAFIIVVLPHPLKRRRLMRSGFVFVAAALFVFASSSLNGQATSHPRPAPDSSSSLAANQGVGDSVETEPSPAHLSPALKRADVAAAVRKVGDWEMVRSKPYFSRDWTFAALYAGYMAAAKAIPDPAYEQAMLAMGNQFSWTPG